MSGDEKPRRATLEEAYAAMLALLLREGQEPVEDPPAQREAAPSSEP